MTFIPAFFLPRKRQANKLTEDEMDAVAPVAMHDAGARRPGRASPGLGGEGAAGPAGVKARRPGHAPAGRERRPVRRAAAGWVCRAGLA